MPEGQPQSQEELMRIEDVTGIDLPDGDVGDGLRFRTSRGSFNAILHRAPDTDRAVIWVCGASGGFGGPGPGTYARMAENFVDGELVGCDSGDCGSAPLPTAVAEDSWGRIKASFR